MSNTQINGTHSSGGSSSNRTIMITHSASTAVAVTAAVDCTPSSINAAAVATKDNMSVNRLTAGGNASSAPGPGGTNSSPDVEAMREWW